MERNKATKGLITKTWNRCKSLGRARASPKRLFKSKSWPCMPPADTEIAGKFRVAPEGCFSVYVGPEKQRFVIKTKYANHPLFIMLLEEAESEYGYSEGPIVLPCKVDVFCKVLMEMDGDKNKQGCGIVKGYGYYNYSLLTPSRLVAINQV